MPNDVIADTGVLYAHFDRDDANHVAARDSVASQRYAFLTTIAVITETAYLLDRCPGETTLDFLRWVRLGGVVIVGLEADDFDRICEVKAKYADLPAGFADATLVAIAERLQVNKIATFDRDFDVYRYRNRSRFRNVLR
jgi:predicted nucleic acid-binding protein